MKEILKYILIVFLLLEFKKFAFFMMKFVEHDHDISDQHDKDL